MSCQNRSTIPTEKKIILIMKIKSIKRVPFEGNVYNIGVANNNNYFANKCLVHNCYVSAKKDGEAYKNPSETWKKWMATYKETLTKDGILLTERPLQIAIGSECGQIIPKCLIVIIEHFTYLHTTPIILVYFLNICLHNFI